MLMFVGLVSGCSLPKIDQDNFTLRVGSAGIQPFIAELERQLGTSAQAKNVNIPGSDVSRMYRLSGHGVTVVVNPMPDDRCNPNAPRHATYKDGEYRIDLVYETRSQSERLSAKRVLAHSAQGVGQTLTPFQEC